MKFWSLLVVAWLPVLQVLLVGLFGALLASSRFNILTSNARTNINKIVYVVFVPSLVFSSLASTVTLKDIISWWFMPVNMGIVFSIGAVLGWVAVKAFRPGEHLQGLVIACCSSGNWGTIPLMIIPANCNEEDNPFGDANTCNSLGLSYVSLSMALGNFYIWTHSYSIMKRSAELYKEKFKYSTPIYTVKEERSGRDTDNSYVPFLPLTSENRYENVRSNLTSSSGDLSTCLINYFRRTKDLLVEVLKELWSPPSAAALMGFTVCNRQDEVTCYRRRFSSLGNPGFCQITRKCCYPMHRADPRRKPYKRYRQEADQASRGALDHCHTFHRPSSMRNRHCRSSRQAWVSTKIPPVPLCAPASVHSSPRHEYWHNSSVV